MYINDFRFCLKNSKQIMFADDTSVFIKDKNIHKLFNKGNNELSCIDQWLIANKLSVNTSKTKCMLFRAKHSNTQHTNLNLIIRNNKIEQVSSLKFLGIYIDLPCSTTLTFRATDKVWLMFKGRRLSKDEMCYNHVLSQLVKLAFNMSYKLLLLNRLFNDEIHKNTKIVYFVDFSV